MTDRTFGTTVPPTVRIELAHAAAMVIAREAHVDALLVKGVGMDASVAELGRASSDVDILIRPTQLPQLLTYLASHGWTRRNSFLTGSSFGHSATWFHPSWGDLDVHRLIPGIALDAAAAFDVLWDKRVEARMAGVPCWRPEPAADALILILHAGRSFGSSRARRDVEHAWSRATPARRGEILALVTRLNAQVGFAAATGDLDAYRSDPQYDLWRVASRGGGRVEEWRARITAEPRLRGKVGLALRAPLVNTDHLAITLGRRPARLVIARAFLNRLRRAAVELWPRAKGHG